MERRVQGGGMEGSSIHSICQLLFANTHNDIATREISLYFDEVDEMFELSEKQRKTNVGRYEPIFGHQPVS
jgi:hypothetical protein